MNSTVFRNSVLMGLLGCYFVLISIHTGSILSLITSDDIAPLYANKLILLFLCLCWLSALMLFCSSLYRTLFAFRYYWEWRCYRELLVVIRYFILNGFLFLFPDLILRYGTYVSGVLSDSAFYLGVAFISILLAWNRCRGLDYVE
ncbi:MAG: hypothetical protein QM652_05255 [Legionella sp.]|uniref:hypothetical protein n=1 Tax=Legionella sp. TaxID=459 RepID=UPI0039E5B4C6